MKMAAVRKTQNEFKESAAAAPVSSTLTLDDIKILRAPFPKERLGVKVQSFSKDRTKAMLVLYLQHTDVQDRLEQVDPAWIFEILSEERHGDSVYVRTRMTLKGVSRENVGEGGDPKAAYSDALKRAAMLFGVGRYLYDMNTVWAQYDDARDRFRNWTVADYERASRGSSVPTPEHDTTANGLEAAAAASAAPKPGLKTEKPEKAKKSVSGVNRTRDQLNRILMNLYRPYLTRYPETRFAELLSDRYKVGETRLLTVEQMEDLVGFMEGKLAA
jgi:hypothetical protein